MKYLVILALIGFICEPIVSQITTRRPAPITTSRPAPITTSRPAPITTNRPAPITTSRPAPITTSRPAPITTNRPAPITTSRPAPITTNRPAPITTSRPAPITNSTRAPTTASRPAPTTSRTTLSPLVIKDMLLKRAAVLELNVKSAITSLQHESRTTQAKYLQTLESEVKRISDILEKTTQVEILQLLESELFWLESRLFIEIQALQAQEKRVAQLVAVASGLKERITAILKQLKNTPVGNALEQESTALDTILSSLTTAKDDRTIDDIELRLIRIEKRINDEVTPIVVPTVKPF